MIPGIRKKRRCGLHAFSPPPHTNANGGLGSAVCAREGRFGRGGGRVACALMRHTRRRDGRERGKSPPSRTLACVSSFQAPCGSQRRRARVGHTSEKSGAQTRTANRDKERAHRVASPHTACPARRVRRTARHVRRARSWCAYPHRRARRSEGARLTARGDKGGQEKDTSDHTNIPTSPPLLGCGGENHPDHAPPTRRRTRRAGVADRDPRGRGLARRGAPSKEKVRYVTTGRRGPAAGRENT